VKIVVVGLGGIGGLVGSRLVAGLSGDSSHEVVFWCRGKTLEAVSERGFRLFAHDGEIVARPAVATCKIEDVGAADVIVFATKNYDLDAAAAELAPAATEKTTVIPLLNGVSGVSTLEKHFPKSDVLGGCIYVSAHAEEPGTVRQLGSTQRIFFGKKGIGEANNQARYGGIEQVLKKSKIAIILTERIDVEMWSKFIFLSPFAGTTTLLKLSIDEVLADIKGFETIRQMIGEIELLARAKNIDLPENIADLTVEKARSFAPLTKTSMQLDQEKGRTTELESLLGYVCKEGKDLGISLPVYETVYRELKNICKT